MDLSSLISLYGILGFGLGCLFIVSFLNVPLAEAVLTEV